MNPMYDRLVQVLTKWSTVPAEAVTLESDIDDDLDIDSLARLELTLALTREFGVVISEGEVFEARTVADLVATLTNRGVAHAVETGR